MRRIGTAVLVGTALLGSAHAAQVSVTPTGKITLKMNGGVCKKTLTDGDLDIDVKVTTFVAWEVKNEDCQAKQKVIVGRTHQSAKYFSVLDCPNGKVTVKKGKTETLKCRVNPECAGPKAEPKVYDYAVCVNGQIAADPELRVGGGSTLGACNEDSTPKNKCEDATE
jgi:hypothetical protein